MARHLESTKKRRTRTIGLIAGVFFLLLFLLAIGIPLAATGKPSYFNRFETTKTEYKTWKGSTHSDVPCQACHSPEETGQVVQARLVGYYQDLIADGKKSPYLKFGKPTREACLKCHRDSVSNTSNKSIRIPHPAHVDLAAEKRDCVSCHKWLAHQESYQQRHKKVVFTGICLGFGCHSGTKKKTECQSCHHRESFKKLTWRSTHPQAVEALGTSACLDYCHKPNQCRECHTTGKTSLITYASSPKRTGDLIAKHSAGGWLSKHGKEAIQDESKCFYCHGSKEVCNSCHARRPAFHGTKATWLAKHKKYGMDKERCLGCHAAKTCDECHKLFKETGR